VQQEKVAGEASGICALEMEKTLCKRPLSGGVDYQSGGQSMTKDVVFSVLSDAGLRVLD